MQEDTWAESPPHIKDDRILKSSLAQAISVLDTQLDRVEPRRFLIPNSEDKFCAAIVVPGIAEFTRAILWLAEYGEEDGYESYHVTMALSGCHQLTSGLGKLFFWPDIPWPDEAHRATL